MTTSVFYVTNVFYVNSHFDILKSQNIGAIWEEEQHNFLYPYLFFRHECAAMFPGSVSKIIISKETNQLNRNSKAISHAINHVIHLFTCVHSWIESQISEKSYDDWETLQKSLNENDEISLNIPTFQSVGMPTYNNILVISRQSRTYTQFWIAEKWNDHHIVILCLPAISDVITDLIDAETPAKEKTLYQSIMQKIMKVIIKDKYKTMQFVNATPDSLYGGWILLIQLPIISNDEIEILQNFENVKLYTQIICEIQEYIQKKMKSEYLINIFLQTPQKPCLNNCCWIIIFVQPQNKQSNLMCDIMYEQMYDRIVYKKNQNILKTVSNFTKCKFYGYLTKSDVVYVDNIINEETFTQCEILSLHAIHFNFLFDLLQQKKIIICLNEDRSVLLSFTCFNQIICPCNFLNQTIDGFVSIMYHIEHQSLDVLGVSADTQTMINYVRNPNFLIQKLNQCMQSKNQTINDTQKETTKKRKKQTKINKKTKKKTKQKIKKYSFVQLTNFAKKKPNHNYDVISEYGFEIKNASNVLNRISNDFSGYIVGIWPWWIAMTILNNKCIEYLKHIPGSKSSVTDSRNSKDKNTKIIKFTNEVKNKYIMIQLTGTNKWSDIAENKKLFPIMSSLRKELEQCIIDINAKNTYSNIFAKIGGN